jgi:hypothetical protein
MKKNSIVLMNDRSERPERMFSIVFFIALRRQTAYDRKQV